MTHPPSTGIENRTWWKRRTEMERSLVIMCVVISFIAVTLVIGMTLVSVKQKHEPDHHEPHHHEQCMPGDNFTTTPPVNSDTEEVCMDPGCIHAASMILQNLDQNTDPCDDFYQFACGQFRKKFIPDDKAGLSMFSVIADELQEQLRMIVSEPINDSDIQPILNAKNMYKLCMNESHIEQVGAEPVKKILKEMGGWPVIEGKTWESGSWSWLNDVYNFRREGFSVDYLINFAVSTDSNNNSVRIIELDQAAIAVARDDLVKGKEHPRVKAYFEYMLDIAELFGANRTTAEPELRKSLDFEIALANISLPSEERRDPEKLYNRMTVADFQSKFDTIRKLLPKHVKFEDKSEHVRVPSFMKNLEKLLQHTENRTIANYMMWRAVASTVSYLPDAFREKQLKYITAITGSTEREARWKECSSQAARTVSLATDSLYVQKFFKENAKKKALELVDNIRQEMYKTFQTVEWMDNTKREAALEKVDSMTVNITYPEELLDNQELTDVYKELEVSGEGTYLEAILNVTKWEQDFNYGRLREPVNKNDWRTHSGLNAFYNLTENSIQLPAGILQGELFSEDRPNYLNYGAIGFVIGQEIIRRFDAQMNGINTQGENIADNGGIKEAYRAYGDWVAKNHKEKRLLGLQKYSPQQMFWLSAATTWCSIYRDETLSRITTGVHSPAEIRVRGLMSNMPEFAKDFNCTTESLMSP